MRALRLAAFVLAPVLAVPAASPAQPDSAARNLEAALETLSAYVQDYYARAQSLVGREDVDLQPIRRDRSMDGPSLRYAYLLRLEWVPPGAGEEPSATMIRELTAVNGRPPRPKDPKRCIQPRETWDEPLAMFLADQRESFEFKWAGPAKLGGERVMRIDFRERPVEDSEPQTEFRKVGSESCMSFRLPGRSRGRVWAAADTGEVLRMDQYIAGPVDMRVPDERRREWGSNYLTLDRWDQTIRYKRVQFTDPDEQIVLPESIQSITIIRGNAQPLRMTQKFTNYRRFLSGGRIVE